VRRSPDSRWKFVADARMEPEHPIESACWRHVNDVEASATIERTVEIYNEQFERERLQPWILAGASDSAIRDRVGVPTDVTRAYRHLFFDVSAFRDELEKRLWVAKYQGSADGKAFLQQAVVLDVEAVAYAMGLPAHMDPTKVLESAMSEQYFRGMALRYARLGSTEATACASMLRGAASQASELMAVRPATTTDALFKLVTRDTTKNVEDLAPHGEILH